MTAITKKKKKSTVSINNKEKNTENEKPTVVSAQLQKQINNEEKSKKKQRRLQRYRKGVVFVKNLPHGFFEEQLKKYFQQFGKVTRLRLARSTRTGNSRGFAYIEFAVPEVAKIAAETMDNYLMFQKLVKAAYISPEQQNFNLFKTKVKKITTKIGKERYVSKKITHRNNEMRAYNRNWKDEDVWKKRTETNLAKLNKIKKKFANTNIDFDQLTMGLEAAKEATSSSEKNKKHKKEEKNTDSESNEENLSSNDATDESEDDEIDGENTAESSEESSEENSNSPKSNILLIKKRKRTVSKSSEDSIKREVHKKDTDTYQTSNKLTKLKSNPDYDDNEESIDGVDEQEEESESSTDEDEGNLIQLRNHKKIKSQTGLDKVIERKLSSGRIQKAKDKQLTRKKANDQNKKFRKQYIEEVAKDLLKNKEIEGKTFKKSSKKKLKN